MKLSDIATKPKLIEITLDDEDIRAEFGEAITFWTWDRQPMSVFLKMAAVDQGNVSTIIDAVRELVLDEAGDRVLVDDRVLPTAVMMKVIMRLVEDLGKLSTPK